MLRSTCVRLPTSTLANIDDLTKLFRVLRCEFDSNVRKINPPSPILTRFRNEERALAGGAADLGTRKELGQNTFMIEAMSASLILKLLT